MVNLCKTIHLRWTSHKESKLEESMLEESSSRGGGGGNVKKLQFLPLSILFIFSLAKRPTVAPYQQYVKPISFFFFFF